MFNNDNDRFLSLGCMAVNLWRIGGYRLLRLLLVLFDDLSGAVRRSLHLYTVYLSSDSLNLWLSRLLGGLSGLFSVYVKVIFIL